MDILSLLIGIVIGAALLSLFVRLTANSKPGSMPASVRALLIGGGGGPDPTNP